MPLNVNVKVMCGADVQLLCFVVLCGVVLCCVVLCCAGGALVFEA